MVGNVFDAQTLVASGLFDWINLETRMDCSWTELFKRRHPNNPVCNSDLRHTSKVAAGASHLLLETNQVRTPPSLAKHWLCPGLNHRRLHSNHCVITMSTCAQQALSLWLHASELLWPTNTHAPPDTYTCSLHTSSNSNPTPSHFPSQWSTVTAAANGTPHLLFLCSDSTVCGLVTVGSWFSFLFSS